MHSFWSNLGTPNCGPPSKNNVCSYSQFSWFLLQGLFHHFSAPLHYQSASQGYRISCSSRRGNPIPQHPAHRVITLPFWIRICLAAQYKQDLTQMLHRSFNINDWNAFFSGGCDASRVLDHKPNFPISHRRLFVVFDSTAGSEQPVRATTVPPTLFSTVHMVSEQSKSCCCSGSVSMTKKIVLVWQENSPGPFSVRIT